MGSEAADMKAAEPAAAGRTTAAGWRPFCPPLAIADDGRFLLDHFLGRFCNPFYRINSEQQLYDETVDLVTGAPLSLADFEAVASGAAAPDALQCRLASFFADILVAEWEADFACAAAEASSGGTAIADALTAVRRVRGHNPFRPFLAPELERRLLQLAAARRGRAVPACLFRSPPVAAPPEQLPVAQPRAQHAAHFRQRIAELCALRRLNLRDRQDRHRTVLIVGGGPAGLIRAVAAVLRGLTPTVLELRPENAARRSQIVVIRSRAVIALLDRLGVIDFLFAEGRIFPLGRLRLEVSLADLETALSAILHLVAADEQGRIVHYGAVIERIDQQQGFARVIARGSDGRTAHCFSPRLIVIADGGRSPTLQLLGVARRDRFRSHTGIVAIFRADGRGLSRRRRVLGAAASKLRYAFHRYVTRRGTKLVAGTILQVPGHHYLGLDLAPDEEMRLRQAIAESGEEHCPVRKRGELQRLLRFWAGYAFEAIRTDPIGSAPHTGGRPIPWLPLDPQMTLPIEVASDRADVFAGHIGGTFVMIEGDAQFTIHPGSAYGCAKAFLSARLFDFLLQALVTGGDERGAEAAQLAFVVNSELMARQCGKITRFFRATA